MKEGSLENCSNEKQAKLFDRGYVALYNLAKAIGILIGMLSVPWLLILLSNYLSRTIL